jgi:hypothetical protein
MHFSLRSIKIRLFLTCWLIFVLHFSTDFVWKHYLILSMVENFSFYMDRFKDLQTDIFEPLNDRVHYNTNHGASMIAAIFYFILEPAAEAGMNHIQERRAEGWMASQKNLGDCFLNLIFQVPQKRHGIG